MKKTRMMNLSLLKSGMIRQGIMVIEMTGIHNLSKGRKRLMQEAIEKADAFNQELADTLKNFEEFRCMQITGGGSLYGKETEIPEYYPVHPFLSKQVRKEISYLPPQEPIQLPKGSNLYIEERDMSFKEPIVSPKMQRNLRVLELRLNVDGYLYSPKAFDPEWEWQTKAIWFRLIGMGTIAVSKRLDKPIRTVKKMFTRLKALTPYYPRISKMDYTTIGVIQGESRTKEIRFGGTAREGVIGSKTEFINRMTSRTQPETGSFHFTQHKKEIIAREKQDKEDKIKAIKEQKRLTKEARIRNEWKPKA